MVDKVKDSKYERSKADPCLYFQWKNGRLALMVSWIDDILAIGHPEDIKEMEADLNKAFVCKSEGRLPEYVGSKVEMTRDKNELSMWSSSLGRSTQYSVQCSPSHGFLHANPRSSFRSTLEITELLS